MTRKETITAALEPLGAATAALRGSVLADEARQAEAIAEARAEIDRAAALLQEED
jgi:hypothetical protein